MQSTGFLDIKRPRPGAMVAVVAIHAAGIGALLMIAPTIVENAPKILEGYNVPKTIVPPDPVKTVEPKIKTDKPIAIDRVKSVITSKFIEEESALATDPGSLTGSDEGEIAIDFPKVEPIKDPVIVGPRFVGRNAQPPYPSAMQRMSIEGAVTVRVLVGIDGRPLRIEAVRVDQEAFFNATRDWALRHWKFAPATRDGEPFQEWRTMTVRFEMNGAD